MHDKFCIFIQWSIFESLLIILSILKCGCDDFLFAASHKTIIIKCVFVSATVIVLVTIVKKEATHNQCIRNRICIFLVRFWPKFGTHEENLATIGKETSFGRAFIKTINKIQNIYAMRMRLAFVRTGIYKCSHCTYFISCFTSIFGIASIWLQPETVSHFCYFIRLIFLANSHLVSEKFSARSVRHAKNVYYDGIFSMLANEG